MKTNKLFLLILGLSISIFILSGCGKTKKSPTEIDFKTDLDTAKKIATDKNQPMVIVFLNSKCPWSKMLIDSTFSDKIVIEMSEKMVFVKLDVIKDSTLAHRFGIVYYPTVVVTKPDGSEIDRLVEYYPPTDFYNEIQLYLIGKETLEDYLTRLEDEPERVEYHLIVAEKYRNRASWDKALEYYNNVIKLGHKNQQDEVEKAMFEIANIFTEKGDYKSSIRAFNDFIKRFPHSERVEDARRIIPYCMVQNGDFYKALNYFKKYLDDYPQGKYVDWVKQHIDELNKVMKKG